MWNSTKNNVIGKIPMTVQLVDLTRLQFDAPVVFVMSVQSIALSTAPKMNIAIIKPTATPMNPITNARLSIDGLALVKILNIKKSENFVRI